jgi:tRNA pseudouridine38-40 synthase
MTTEAKGQKLVEGPDEPEHTARSPSEEDAPAAHAVRLVVAYDGTEYCGFQKQAGQRTVQEELERAAARMAGHAVQVKAASRTDSGVHALGQVIAFHSRREIPARGWRLGLNAHLPPDIRVQAASLCEAGYNPRFDSLGKRYRYLIQMGEAKNPLLRHRAWQLGHLPLDPAPMREAAKLLEGTHDFAAFRSADDERETTVRTLWSVSVTEGFTGDPSLVAIDVHGNAFMKNMVRILSGTLVKVGRKRMPPARMTDLLSPGADRSQSGETAPAHGLTLLEVQLGRLALTR